MLEREYWLPPAVTFTSLFAKETAVTTALVVVEAVMAAPLADLAETATV